MDKLKELINGKSKKDKYKARNNVRHVFQSFWFLLTNSFFEGFKTGKIYGGKWKQLCVPGMNCYSCPGAKGSCPIGALQAVIGSPKFKFSYYIVGFLFFVGALIGRGVCGYLCPFGLVQDLLHKIPFVKKIETFKGDKALRKAKYLILLVFVILLPLFLVDIIGQGAPYFCKLICPVGMMEGGIPLVLMNKSMRGAIGFLYAWKGLILILTILLSIVIYRPFCKYICPLGAIYSLFNSVSLFRYTLDHQKCIHCGRCKAVCEMQCDPVKNCNDLECIRCGKCKNACPVDAIACGITKPDVSKETVKAKA
ncbi:MAG: 4Fe-4S binding protein [Oribacterium parvum]|uniref:4Fe-4S binding protein n=1 Tax=Oribacterium parvum TaxID=1501329 RepID=A0A930DPJ1_9FIRM|nr:4Fe-4S binding protein [Oribacterium parvum]